MWGVSLVAPAAPLPPNIRLVAAIAIALVGVTFSIAGVAAFRRAKTTLNPLKPGTSSSLVTSGVYRFTRNPMYVGLALGLLGWAVFLSSAWSLLGPLVFILYMTRFQIVPEERALSNEEGCAAAVPAGAPVAGTAPSRVVSRNSAPVSPSSA